MIRYELDRALEQNHAVALSFQTLPGPPGMMNGQTMPFRVRHHSQNTPGPIADRSDILNRSVRIPGVSRARIPLAVRIAKNYLSVVSQFSQHAVICRNKLPLRMGDGQIYEFVVFYQNTPTAGCLQVAPPVHESMTVVDGEGRFLLPAIYARQQAGFHKNLKAIADSQDESTALYERFQGRS